MVSQDDGDHILAQYGRQCDRQRSHLPNSLVQLVRTQRLLRVRRLGKTKTDATRRTFPLHTMTPVWVFPAYPLLLNGPFAASLIASSVTADEELVNTTAVALAALAAQGTGFLIALMISAAFLYRLMTQRLPTDMQRPAVVCIPVQ